ncbi:serine/threonine-protein kinase [Phytohabitans sp. LJ34]|uniref:serine/threonine-protein kinase n=1 Tax=Phytohabitans sp. LJ34 TaxID=3452217 RepID=UPI003F8A2E2E
MGDRIIGDRYRLEEEVGRGGTATVWRAVDLDTGVPVAVKILDREQAARPVALERLRREAETVARLEHPNIVASHDLGAGFLAMELVEGHTVAQLLTGGGRLPVDQALSIAEQVGAALAAAHEAGVIHRDIKPGNLIVSHSGTVKVCDFGIARLQARDGDAALTSHSQAVGTCEYMAPEQATGDGVDARTDLYSLGCVLYAMLTGRPPFLGETAIAVMHHHLNRAPATVRSVRDDVPPEVDDLIGRLLAKDPAGRPATATEVREELAAIRAAPAPAEPATAVVARVIVAPQRPAGRHRMPHDLPAWLLAWPTAEAWLRRWWIAAVSGALIVLTVVAVVLLLPGGDPDRPPAAAPAVDPPAATQPAEPTPAPTSVEPSATASSPSASRTSPAGPVDRLAAFATTVQRLVDSGDLGRKEGRELQRKAASIAESVQNGRSEGATEKLHDLDERLAELRRDGKLSRAAFEALDVIDPIIAALG